ncbi:MAG: glycosyltransferase [Myxococcales bacterium]|nr:glycosyltransferase [Myxococcales bacterium]
MNDRRSADPVRDRPRVLQCTFEYGPAHVGGLGTMLTALCGGLPRAGIRPVVVLPGSSHQPPWPRVDRRSAPRCHADIYRDGETEVWMLRSDLLDDDAIYPEDAVKVGMAKTEAFGACVADLLGDLDVDLVHLHDAYAYACLPECRRRGLPSLFTVHRLHDDEPPFARAERIAIASADEVSTVSAAYARERGDVFTARAPVHAVANGLDHRLWRPFADGPEGRASRRARLLASLELPERPTFLYLGRLDPDQKGVDVLLEAWRGGCAGVDANLLVCGTGDRELAEAIRERARADAERVRFFDRYFPQAEVRELFAAADCALIPSRYEPFGLVQLEALAMGSLVVASRTGGLADVLVDVAEPGGFARLVAPGDATALAQALRDEARCVATEPARCEERRRLGAAQAQRYSLSAMAERYAALYRAILRRHASAASSPRE